MEEQKSIILKAIIEEHIKTAMPIGSTALVEKYNLNISPATARQRMAQLEEDGYIFQPHTSAGRVPSQKAYTIYVSELKESDFKDQNFKNIEIDDKQEDSLKQVAKNLAQISGLAIFWAFWKRNLYYTGISNLLRQPEFSEISKVHDISTVIDEMDNILEKNFDKINYDTNVMIGDQSPFGNFTSTIVAKYKNNKGGGLCGIIGPLRMDYKKNIALINYIYKKLQE